MITARSRTGVANIAAIMTLACLMAASAGVATSFTPVAAAAFVGLGLLVALLTFGQRLERIFLFSVSGLLLGYMLQGRGFAYFGFPPLYVGELVLGLGVLCLLFARLAQRMSFLQAALVGFMFAGLLRTIPYVSTYGIDAVRDAALWYYALYAVIMSLLLTRVRLLGLVQLFAKLLPFLVVWLALMSTAFRFLPESLPHFPGSPLPILSVMKASDRSVALVVLAGFVVTGLYDWTKPRTRFPILLFWLSWMVSAVLVFAQNRGGMLAIVSALLLVGLLQPSKQWLTASFVGFAALLALMILDPTIEMGGGRAISVDQIATNITSIFSDESGNQGGVQGTKEWRLQWWEDIWSYTVQGEHFLGGKGFGINLANDDGYQVTADESLRSPHSSHMSVLARMGVPGILLWIGLHVGFASQMILSIMKSRARHQREWAQIKTWLLATWLAAMVTSSFDVYLEGPQGGIVFWCVFGAGLAAIRMDDEPRLSSADESPNQPRSATNANPSRA